MPVLQRGKLRLAESGAVPGPTPFAKGQRPDGNAPHLATLPSPKTGVCPPSDQTPAERVT